jgi:hypothetical protein
VAEKFFAVYDGKMQKLELAKSFGEAVGDA